MIIETTTLDSEQKVKEAYGENTHWIQHSGYVLRGATTGVLANSASKDGGNDNAVVVQHSHSVTTSGGNHSHAYTYTSAGTVNGEYGASSAPFGVLYHTMQTAESGNLTMSGTAANNTGWSDGVNANIPNYKNVYIWERVE